MARGPAKKKARAVQHLNTRIMNVFSLFADARQAARWHADAHMKLALEAAQIASTVYWHYGQTPPYPDPYRPTHAHHPCVRWACQGFDQFYHVVAYGLALTLTLQFRRRRVQAAKPLHALCRAGAPRARVLEAYRRAARTAPPTPGKATTSAARRCWPCWRARRTLPRGRRQRRRGAVVGAARPVVNMNARPGVPYPAIWSNYVRTTWR